MTIYEKIAKIQDEVEVRKEADNPFFHSKYATYEGVLNAIHSAMRKYKLVVFHTFEPSLKDGYIVVVTTLMDTEEPFTNTVGLPSKLEIPLLKNDPQSAGSAITYAKRYSLLAILGLGTEDDDGNYSSGKTTISKSTASEPKDLDLWCDVHKCDMKLNKFGKPFHIKNDEFCNGAGFPSDPRPTR